jgi:hypothetical protein
MGRVNRLMERRALRRAADMALVTSLGNATPSRAGGAADQDFHYSRAEPAEPAEPVHVHDPVTEPIQVTGVAELPPDPTDDYGWVECDDAPPPPALVQHPLRAYPLAATTYVQPNLDFAVSDYRERHWSRSTPAGALLVAAVIGAVVCGGWLVFRSSATSVEQSRTESPTSAPPVSSKAPPAAVSAHTPPPAPAPPPPPPPPAAQPTYSAPQRQYSPRYSEPTPAQKPRVDVTRAPMSVAPVPKPVPGSDSNTPGDTPKDSGGRRRGCFGFC